ncbi:MAG: acyl transferase [Chitinophagaceae bacterium]|nr:acyl transferase [Chitinophagaceae bacterium]
MQWNHKVFGVSEADFEALSLEIFRYQFENNRVYNNYVKALGVNPSGINTITQIPFLPIRFFKSHPVQTGDFIPETVFESSGTTGTVNSRHLVKDISLYTESFTRSFELFYGPVKNWCIIGLLPSYLERSNSSLVFMVNNMIKESAHEKSGFYLDEYDQLFTVLNELERQQQKTLLIGVTFALLDFAEQFQPVLKNTVVMETGGMKGRRKEMIRPELHELLTKSFHITTVHSEYGMTELLSQAWSTGEGIFNTPPWMKILVRDEEDPLLVRETGAGAINVIDLANVHSCSFIATDDAGKVFKNRSFEILGRMDGSDLRGCSLLMV